MRAVVMHAPGDVRVEEIEAPVIVEPTDAIIRVTATCVCGSDLWDYRGVNTFTAPVPIGHEYCGVVEAVGPAVKDVRVGQFVVGPFFACCNRCPACLAGFQSDCAHLQWYDGCQAELLRVPMADGTLVATPEPPDEHLIPSLLALSDVMCTGWHAAVSAGVGPGMTVAVVGDGAVGLSAVLASVQLGADRVIAMSRHADRQAIAKEFGATDIVAERGEEGVARIKEMTEGIGADAVLECVGTEDARKQAVDAVRPGGMVGVVGVPHGGVDIEQMFWANKGIHGGVAPVRAYLEQLLQMVLDRKIQPGKVFDLELPLSEVARAYKAMDERTATKVLLRP